MAVKTIFLQVEYLGTAYFGFQIQHKPHKHEPTVQDELEKALKKLFNQTLRISYTSRTDSGVHAKAQGVSFLVDTKIPLASVKRALNSYLPNDIRVVKLKLFPAGWNIRRAVVSKVYRYTIDNKKEQSVFEAPYAWKVARPLDLALMRSAADLLEGKKDFMAFAKDAKRYQSTIRDLKKIILKKQGRKIYIEFEADGFMRNMVRNLAAFLVKVAGGELSLAQAKLIINGRLAYNNCPAPAQGLCLTKVNYV